MTFYYIDATIRTPRISNDFQDIKIQKSSDKTIHLKKNIP